MKAERSYCVRRTFGGSAQVIVEVIPENKLTQEHKNMIYHGLMRDIREAPPEVKAKIIQNIFKA